MRISLHNSGFASLWWNFVYWISVVWTVGTIPMRSVTMPPHKITKFTYPKEIRDYCLIIDRVPLVTITPITHGRLAVMVRRDATHTTVLRRTRRRHFCVMEITGSNAPMLIPVLLVLPSPSPYTPSLKDLR